MANNAQTLDVSPDMPEEDQAMAKIIKERVSSFDHYRQAESLEARINIAYLCGYQNIHIVNGIVAPLPTNMVVNIVDNKILPAVNNDVAVATKSTATFDIVPTTTTQEDEATAKVASQLVKYLQRINGRTLSRDAAVMWYDIAGVGWRKCYWDDKARVVGRNPKPGEEGHNPELQPLDPVFQGEVVIEHVPNTELIYDFRVKDVNKLEWIIHAKTITMSEVKTRWGTDFAALVNPTESIDVLNDNIGFEANVMRDFNSMANGIMQANMREAVQYSDDELIKYYEFWHKPNASMPLGAYVVMVGDRLAENKPFPLEDYRHGELPFIPAAPMALSGIAPRAVSRITQARPLQREYNRLRSMVADGLDAMGNSVIMVPAGSKVEYKRLSNTHGNIIEYEGPMKPTREPGVQIPGAVFAYLQEVRRGIDEVFAFPDVSRGQTTSSSPDSARGLQLLQDASHTQLGPMVHGFDQSDEKLVNQAIALGLRFYKNRLLPIVGEDNSWTLFRINPEEVTGRVNVIVRTGSSLPLNKALEADRAFTVWQSGLLGDPNSPEVRNYVIKQMDLGGIDNILANNAKQKDFAQKEFITAEQMVQQMPPIPAGFNAQEAEALMSQYLFVPPPNAFDNHMVHAGQHTDFILDNYWKYKATGLIQYAILGAAMVDHNNMHHQMMEASQQRMLQAQTQSEAFTKGNTLEQIMAKQAKDFKKIESDESIAKASKSAGSD
jgi:hypothetical protein